MKLRVIRENLLSALTLATAASGSKRSLPVLQNVYLATEDGTLTVAATDLELAYEARVSSSIAEPGKTTVNARDLLNAIKATTKSALIEISVDEKDRVLIQSGSLSQTLNGISAEEYPVLASRVTRKDEASFRVNSIALHGAVTQVLPAVAVDAARPILTGMLFEFGNGQLHLRAADNYRLAASTLDLIPGSGKHEDPLIVPGTSLALLLKTLPKTNEYVTVTYSRSANLVWFAREGVLVASRLIDGHFPNYQQIIPTTQSTWITVDKQSLTTMAKAASKASKTNAVRLSLSDDGIQIETPGNDDGKFSATIAARDLLGDDTLIAFNPRYLADLDVLSGDTLALGLSGPLTPATFRSDTGPFVVLMPIRLSGFA